MTDIDDDAAFAEDEKARIAALHKSAPEVIWLQVDPEAEQFDGWEAQTWCSDKINDTDVEYVKAERIAALEAEIESECQLHLSTVRRYEAENAALRQQLLVAQAEVKRLNNALLKYGRHGTLEKICDAMKHSDYFCNCGLHEALSTPSDTGAIDALQRDAERYRWLRAQHQGVETKVDAEWFEYTEPTEYAWTVFQPDMTPVSCIPGELDAAIDAAIQEAKP